MWQIDKCNSFAKKMDVITVQSEGGRETQVGNEGEIASKFLEDITGG